MTLEQNITAILESCFSGFKDELIEACVQRIMRQIERQSDTPQTELTAKCLNCHNAKACKEKHWDGCIYEPQTDCDKCIWSVCNYNKVDWDADTPHTDCSWREKCE